MLDILDAANWEKLTPEMRNAIIVILRRATSKELKSPSDRHLKHVKTD